MKYIDYREALGCGFDDSEKLQLLKNKIHIYLNQLHKYYYETDRIVFSHEKFFIEIGKIPYGWNDIRDVLALIDGSQDLGDLLSMYLAFCKYCQTDNYDVYYMHEQIADPFEFLKESLNNLAIQYEIIEDEDGSFLFPKGVPELDETLVNEPYYWLNQFETTKVIYSRTLRQIANQENARDCADNLRKTFETFLQEFFGNEKNLDSNRGLIADYLSSCQINSETNQMIQALINRYRLLNDKAVKHNDEIDNRSIEFLLYQTGIFMRLLISLKNE